MDDETPSTCPACGADALEPHCMSGPERTCPVGWDRCRRCKGFGILGYRWVPEKVA